MSAALAASALAAALLLWVPPDAARRARVRSLAGAAPGPVGRLRRVTGGPPGPVRRRVEAAAGALAVFALLGGGVLGTVAAMAGGVALDRVLRRAGDEPERTGAAQVHADLPVVCDLLAVCLAAGTPVGEALAAVAGSVPGPLGDRLGQVAALYRLGATPQRAWAEAGPPVDALARVVVRAGESGSSVVPALARLAVDLRGDERVRVDAAVRRAGVWVLAPLGLCFLPAFLCLGVVPLVLGIASDVFG
ncbi:type II secretion system F family protein [Modestobacter roseus]|uniref:type II secretion system F family protein n=1 Tax=Modestobacter roseus TaxID=1181884 RepID=UPI0034E03A16